MEKTQQPAVPAATHGIQAHLVSVEDQVDLSTPLTAPPIVPENPHAVDAYTRLGAHDAAHPGADIHTGPAKPRTPSETFVLESARAPLTALGERFAAFRAALAQGSLGQIVPEPVPVRQVFRGALTYVVAFALLLLAANVVEVLYGVKAAEVLAGRNSNESLAAAIALSLALNGTAFIASGWLHRTHPSLVVRQGGKTACIAAILVALVAVTLGLVVGGFDVTDLGVASGGGRTTVESTTSSQNALLFLTYTTILVLVAFGVAAAHLLIAHILDARRIELTIAARNAAERASLSPSQQAHLARRLCSSYLSAIADAHRQGRVRVDAYTSEFKRTAPPELSELFVYPDYDSSAPAWDADVHAMIAELDADHHHPHPSKVTRIA